MFERRLKIFLGFLVVMTIALICRVVQIQLIDRNYWKAQTADYLKRPELVETTRGSILDRNRNVVAADVPCVNACIDYRAIPEEPDAAWVLKLAKDDLRAQMGDDDFNKAVKSKSPQWQEKLDAQVEIVKARIARMWVTLGQMRGHPEEIAARRQAIVQMVQTRQKTVEAHINQHATDDSNQDGKPDFWYQQFVGDDADLDTGPVDVAEQNQAHVILADIKPIEEDKLASELDQMPGLVLRPSKQRAYYYGEVACHVIGHLVPVTSADVVRGAPLYDDDLRRYRPNDLIGAGGIEALCETTLRGSRGSIEHISGVPEPVVLADAKPGRDVRMTIDMELETHILDALNKQRVHIDPDTHETETREHQHGAVVVIDVATGQVLAMVSNPGFDPNTLSDDYAQLSRDDLNLPLLNRATQTAVEPGSTVKPMVGSGAITDHVFSSTDTVQCKGVLVIENKAEAYGHCWTYALFTNHKIPEPSHNLAPGGNLVDDQLTISDGLERSCNVVFATVADKLGMAKLTTWFDRFGLGRPTGIGIEENPGEIFRTDKGDHDPTVRPKVWSSGIGEQFVLATPLQMANVAATVARDGVWIRPQLIMSHDDIGRATTRPAADPGPDRVDLHLSQEAITAVKKGMYQVVNSPYGTGTHILPRNQDDPQADDPLAGIEIAGKTGTAQSSPLAVPARTEDGKIVTDENGKVLYRRIEVGTPGTESWYQTSDGNFDHAWFIGYAPADHPQVAFCVFVEYGEAGNRVAGAIAHDVLAACVNNRYLSRPKSETTVTDRANSN